MDTLLSDNINSRNTQNIRYQINNKKGSNPYYSTQKTNKNDNQLAVHKKKIPIKGIFLFLF